MSQHRIRTKKAASVAGPSGPAGFTDSISLEIGVADSNAVPTDAATFNITLGTGDTNAEQTENILLNISGHSDTTAEPTDARSATIRVWLSASAGSGVTTPANADGQFVSGSPTLATITTALAGASNEVMLSALGTNVPSGITFSSAILTVWARFRTTLVTSTARVQIEAIAATFTSPVTVFTTSALAGDSNFLTAPITFDLVAAGINTLAKLQDMRFRAETIDAVAGVTPAIVDVDAAACDIVATSI